MKPTLVFFLSFCCLITITVAQKNNFGEENLPKGKSNSAALGINLALGKITATYNFGFGFQFSRSNHRFGRLNSLPSSPIGFIYNIGADYLLGKKDSYNVKYKGYSFAHAFAGLIMSTGLNGNFNLTAGPSVSFYTNSSLWGIGFCLNGNFYFPRNIGLSPSLLLLKQQESNNIWITSIKGTYSF